MGRNVVSTAFPQLNTYERQPCTHAPFISEKKRFMLGKERNKETRSTNAAYIQE